MARANGKLILLGEHAVVYGVPAIAAGIERGVEARASVSDGGAQSSLRIADRSAFAGDDSDLGRAFQALLAELGVARGASLQVTATLELPPGSGLGVSAALGVAIARAVLAACGEDEAPIASKSEPRGHEASEREGEIRNRARVFSAAAAWEGVYHGSPSGIDAAAAATDGCIWYEKDVGAEPLALARELPIAIAIAGPPASTKLMVESVARFRERRPEIVHKTLEGVRALVNNARLCLEAGDLPGLGSLMNYNQMLLSALFVSTEGIERCCALAREAGALGAKLTGAGGGGAVIALGDGASEPVLAAWRAAGIDCFGSRVRRTLRRGAE